MSAAPQVLTVPEKVAQQAARHNLKLNVTQFIADWNAGMDEAAIREKYALSGQQITDLVIGGGLKPRFPANDSREKDTPELPSAADLAEGVQAAHQRIDSLSSSHGSSIEDLRTRVAALEQSAKAPTS